MTKTLQSCHCSLILTLALSSLPVACTQSVPIKQIGTWPGYFRGEAGAVFMVGTTAYVGLRSSPPGSIWILDVSDPANPVRLGGWESPVVYNRGSYIGVHVVGNLAYVADDIAGLSVLDISNPANPIRIGACAVSGGRATSVFVSGLRAYLSCYQGGLQVMDVADPANPVWLGGADTPGLAMDVKVAGDYAYVADDNIGGATGGLYLFDVRNPAQPVLAGSYVNRGRGMGVAVEGTHAYLADFDAGVFVIDVSVPTNPTFVSKYVLFNNLMSGIAAIGNRVYVADSGSAVGGFHALDVSDPANLVALGHFKTNTLPHGVAVAGNLAALASWNSGVEIVELSDETHPIRTGWLTTSATAQDIALVGDRALVADGNDGLQVLDVSLPHRPVRLARYNHRPEQAAKDNMIIVGVATRGAYAYVTDAYNVDQGLSVVDVSDPAHPVAVGHYVTPCVGGGLAVAGDYVYLAGPLKGLEVISVNDPAKPALIGRYPGVGGSGSAGVAVAGNLACVASDAAGLLLFDVTDPANLVLRGKIDTGGQTFGCCLVGQRAYVVDNKTGLQIIDVSDPDHPGTVGSCPITPVYSIPSHRYMAEARGIDVIGMLAYVAAGEAGLQVFDISDPTHPVYVAGHPTRYRAWAVKASGNNAYVADTTAGLQVIQVGTPPRPRLTPMTGSGAGQPFRFLIGNDDGSALQAADVARLRVETSGDFRAWTGLDTTLTLTNGSALGEDLASPVQTLRFYRAWTP